MEIENLFGCSCSQSCLFLCEYELSFQLESVEQYYKHNFARMGYMTDVSVVFAELNIILLGIVITIDLSIVLATFWCTIFCCR